MSRRRDNSHIVTALAQENLLLEGHAAKALGVDRRTFARFKDNVPNRRVTVGESEFVGYDAAAVERLKSRMPNA